MRTHLRLRTVLQDAIAYCIALAIIWYLARNVSPSAVLHYLVSSNLLLFVPAVIASFLIWFLGETYLFAKLFSFFHAKTSFREALPAVATMYFLQAINALLANAAVIVFLHNRKKVAWGTATATVAFQGFIDLFVMTTMAILAGLFVPTSPIHTILPYALGALGGGILIALWFRWRRNPAKAERWLLARPSFKTFRTAHFKHYAALYGIRFAIFLPQGFLYYLEARAFHIRIPLAPVLALTPAIIAVGSLPVTPNGLGFVQTLMVKGFAGYASRSQLLSMSLTVGVLQLLCRVLLGLTSARHFASGIIRFKGHPPNHGPDLNPKSRMSRRRQWPQAGLTGAP